MLLVTSDRFAHHMPPAGHPERVERADVMAGVAVKWRERGGRIVEPRDATRDELARVHDDRYLDALAATAGRPVALDPDTYTSSESVSIAALAAGAGVVAVEHALASASAAVALVRPPGHHAERDRAMGFCLYNNAAVAAAHAREAGAARVAVVDFDVHHGNGTQAIFYEDPSVLYVSIHQFPYYPGTGAAGEVGRGAGAGRTVNVPLEAGATDADYDLVFSELVEPVLNLFAPELLIVSAGYDAHQRDPLAGMRLSSDAFSMMMTRLWRVAGRVARRRLVAVVEGGYDLRALSEGLDATLRVLDDDLAVERVSDGDTRRAAEAIAQVRAAQRPHWPTL